MSRGTGNEHKAELDPELFGLPNSEVEVGFYSKVYHFVLRPTVDELSYLLSHALCAGATAWLRATIVGTPLDREKVLEFRAAGAPFNQVRLDIEINPHSHLNHIRKSSCRV